MPLYFKNNAHLNFETPKNLAGNFCGDIYPKQNLPQMIWEVVINVKLFSSQAPKKSKNNSGIVIGKFFRSEVSRQFPISSILFSNRRISQQRIYPGADFLSLLFGLFRFNYGQLSLQPCPAFEYIEKGN